jgi:antitoxin YefM
LKTVTLREANLKLEELVQQVLADGETWILVTESGDRVVILPLEEYNSWKETLYLLRDPSNADHLRRSIAELKAGKAEERDLLEV